jgi:hypothetical protein
MGGGGYAGLTADRAARAVIAAAQVMGADPVMVMTGSDQAMRRVRLAAAAGLQAGGACTVVKASTALGVHSVSVTRARNSDDPIFDRAEASAADAVVWAIKADAERRAAEEDEEERPGRLRQDFVFPVMPRCVAAEPKSSAGTGSQRADPRDPRSEVKSDAPLRDRLVAILSEQGPISAPSLAILSDAKELEVSRALSQLQHEGVVSPLPVPPEGRRYQAWSLCDAA